MIQSNMLSFDYLVKLYKFSNVKYELFEMKRAVIKCFKYLVKLV